MIFEKIIAFLKNILTFVLQYRFVRCCCVRLEADAAGSHSDFAPRTRLFRDSFVRFFLIEIVALFAILQKDSIFDKFFTFTKKIFNKRLWMHAQ